MYTHELRLGKERDKGARNRELGLCKAGDKGMGTQAMAMRRGKSMEVGKNLRETQDTGVENATLRLITHSKRQGWGIRLR